MRVPATKGAFAAVIIGGVAGGVLRFLLLEAFPVRVGGLPLALLAVNVAGSALIGLVFAFSEPGRTTRLPDSLALGLMAGFCGALTTFSTVAVEMLSVNFLAGAFQIVFSLSCWVVTALLGLALGRALNPRLDRGHSEFRGE